MSRLSQSSTSSSLDDASGTEEEKPSALDLCHVETEAGEMNNSPTAMETSVPNDFGSRCYRCRICGEDFNNKSAMFLHLRDKHSSADKYYKCVSCYKSFPSSQQLTQHMLVHTNVRRYRCQYCDKAFKQLSHVQQHERIHTGELPYHCPLSSCERSFRQLSSMKQHLKGHCQPIVPSNISSVSSSSPSSETGMALSPKFTSDVVVLPDELPHATSSVKYEVPDSSSGFSALNSPAAACSSESENSLELSHVKEEEPAPVKKKMQRREETGCVTPLYQRSLIDLSSKLGEIKRRQRKLRLQATILP